MLTCTKRTLTVEIGGLQIADGPDDVIVTYSLGSCIALAVYDPVARIGGMIHGQLPLSKDNPSRAQQAPLNFTDLAVTALLQTAIERGAEKSRLIAKVAGGANILDPQGTFRIGERNFTVVRKLLWKNSILIGGQHVGGELSRTFYLHLDSGSAIVKTNGERIEI